jgi:hypothetical protein
MSDDTQPKRSKNPFINMAADAKAKKAAMTPSGKAPVKAAPKPTKGFGTAVKRTAGRGR